MASGYRTSERVLLTGAALGFGILAREALSRLTEADLAGKVALITGGSRGLGLLLARELARQGCSVAICARDEDELDRAKQTKSNCSRVLLRLFADVVSWDFLTPGTGLDENA